MSAPAIGRKPGWLDDHDLPTVDWSHPLATGLVAAYRPAINGGAIDLAGNCPPMVNTGVTPIRRSGAWGDEMYGNAGRAGAKLIVVNTSPLRVQPPFTYAWVGTAVANNSGAPLHGMNYDDADTSPWASWMFYGNGTNTHVEFNGSGVYDETSGTLPPLGPSVYLATMTPGAQTFYINGVISGTDNNAFTGVSYHGSDAACYQFHYYTGEADAVNAGSMLGCLWSRALSTNEIITFTTDPFCFLRR